MSSLPKPALERLLRNSAQYASLRMRMLEIDLGAERDRLWAMTVTTLLLSLAGLASIHFLGALVIAATWDTPWRLHAIATLLLATVLATVAAWQVLRRLRRTATRPLASLVEDLQSFSETAPNKSQDNE